MILIYLKCDEEGMRTLTKYLANNEKGSSFLLVLFLVFLIAAVTAPLLLTVSQGQLFSIRGENTEKAYYTADSGAAIFKRALQEAYRSNSNFVLKETHINTVIDQINNNISNSDLPIEVSHVKPGLVGEFIRGYQVTMKGTAGAERVQRDKTITLNFFTYDPVSSQGEIPGIFGRELTVQGPSAAFLMEYFRLPDNMQLTSADFELDYKTPQFMQELDEHFAMVMNASDRPSARMPSASLVPEQPLKAADFLPASYASCSDPFNQASTAGSPLPGRSCSGNVTINGQNKTMVIQGDVMASGDITLNAMDGNVIVNGNVVAGGNIGCSSKLSRLTITGHLIANGSINMNCLIENNDSLMIGGTVSSTNGDITFTNRIKGIAIDGSLTAKNNIVFSDIDNKLQVKQNISSSTGSIQFNGSNTYGLTVGQSVMAAGPISFRTVHGPTIGSHIMSGGTITFSDQVNGLYAGGSIISQGNMAFGLIQSYGGKRSEVNGDISSNGSLTFNDHVSGLITGGSIKSRGSVVFARNIQQGSQIGGDISSLSGITFKGNLDGVVVRGSIIGDGITFEQHPQAGTIIHGSINSYSSVNFYQNVDFTVGKSIYAERDITIASGKTVNKLYIGDSMYANNDIFFGGNVDNLVVQGSVMSKNHIDFEGFINAMKIEDFLTSKIINFNKNIAGSQTKLGGISAQNKLDFKNQLYINGTIVIDYSPPGEYTDWSGGGTAQPGAVVFSGWSSGS